MCSVQRLLGAKRDGLDISAALVEVEGELVPVRERIVAGDPDEILVAGDSAQMMGNRNEQVKRVGNRPAAEFTEFGIESLGLRKGVECAVAVDAEQVFRAVHGLNLLAIALLFILGVGDVLGDRHPLGELSGKTFVIGGGLMQHLIGVVPHGVERDTLAGRKGPDEADHLLAGVGKIVERQIAAVKKQDQRVLRGAFGLWVLRGVIGELLGGGRGGCRGRRLVRGLDAGLHERADVLFDAVVIDLEIVGLEVGDGVALFVESDDIDIDQAGIDAQSDGRVLRGGRAVRRDVRAYPGVRLQPRW